MVHTFRAFKVDKLIDKVIESPMQQDHIVSDWTVLRFIENTETGITVLKLKDKHVCPNCGY